MDIELHPEKDNDAILHRKFSPRELLALQATLGRDPIGPAGDVPRGDELSIAQ